MLINSQNRTQLQIGFRLGGNSGTAQGTAWFSDFKLEKGVKQEDSNWKIVCFVFKNLDVDINGENMKFAISGSEVSEIKSNMNRFKNSCQTLSKGKISIEYDVYEIDEPIKTISYSDEHGYYIDPYDVNGLIEDSVLENEYDYVFAAVKMGNQNKQIPVNDWIGLRKHGLVWYRIFRY